MVLIIGHVCWIVPESETSSKSYRKQTTIHSVVLLLHSFDLNTNELVRCTSETCQLRGYGLCDTAGAEAVENLNIVVGLALLVKIGYANPVLRVRMQNLDEFL